MDPRLEILPAQFRAPDAKLIVGRTFAGTPEQPGQDNAAHVPEPHDGPIVYLDCRFLASGASEGLKLPRKFWLACIDCVGTGGTEDVLDICRGAHLWFVRFRFERLLALRDVTCKGGAWDVHFIDCQGLNKLQLGEYSKYDSRAVYPDGRQVKASPFRLARPRTRQIYIQQDHAPHVECIHADDPLPSVSPRMAGENGGQMPGGQQTTTALRRWAAPYFWARATFFPETNPAPAAEFNLLPEELA